MDKKVNAKDKIIVAIDVSTESEIRELLEILSPHVNYFKFGFEAIWAMGILNIINICNGYFDSDYPGGKIFFDTKFFDIPNTVTKVSAVVVKDRATKMFNVHCLGGEEMMKDAKKASQLSREVNPLVFGVTILTSLDYDNLVKVGIFNQKINDEDTKKVILQNYILKLAKLAQDCGLDGVVSSAENVKAIKDFCGKDFLVVTPGIRPPWAAGKDDQKRIATPTQAIKDGTDYLVVGRPITNPPPNIGGPAKAVELIVKEIEEALLK